MKEIILKNLEETLKVKKEFIIREIDKIVEIVNLVNEVLEKKHKIVLFGNGGSAADAQHIAAEFIGRFKKERKALPAIAFSVNTSVLTSVANDYDYSFVFKRQVEALVKKGDIVFGISTSGKAKNVIEGIKEAKKIEAYTIGFTGGNGAELAKIVDFAFIVPSFNTAYIQESHIMLGHLICELIDQKY